MKPSDHDDKTFWFLLALLFILPFILLFLVLIWASEGKTTEYSMISRDNLHYCDQYAKRSGGTVADMTQAYGDCIRVLPARLPMPGDPETPAPGTAPATVGTEEWQAACAANYRTWDAETGTVVRSGSPRRVRCPCGRVEWC